jgi:hypothetical protein
MCVRDKPSASANPCLSIAEASSPLKAYWYHATSTPIFEPQAIGLQRRTPIVGNYHYIEKLHTLVLSQM